MQQAYTLRFTAGAPHTRILEGVGTFLDICDKLERLGFEFSEQESWDNNAMFYNYVNRFYLSEKKMEEVVKQLRKPLFHEMLVTADLGDFRDRARGNCYVTMRIMVNRRNTQQYYWTFKDFLAFPEKDFIKMCVDAYSKEEEDEE